MIALVALSALAAEPVTDIVWARPYTLAEPVPWTMRGDAPPVAEGWILELRVDPVHAVPTQGPAPVLYVGALPAMRLSWDPHGGCAVVLTGPADLASTPVFFGPSTLPERVTAADGLAARDAAAALVLPAARVTAAVAAGGPVLAAVDLRDAVAVAADRVERCSETDPRTLDALRSPTADRR